MATYKVSSMSILAGVLVPGVVMLGARFVGNAPADSNAQFVTEQAPEIFQFPTVSLINHRAFDHAQMIHSPFWFEDSAITPFAGPDEIPLEPRPSTEEFIPDVLVTSILPNARNPMAVINSKPCRIGDDIEGGWKLIGIDGDTRTVLLLHSSGKRKTVSLSKNH